MKKKTHEEYVSELAKINPNVEVIEKYVDARTKITHRCLIHNIDWKITPGNALLGHGCKKCKYEKIGEKLTKYHDTYVKELSVKNPNVEVIGRYTDANTKIEHRCLIHDEYWYISPSNALKGCGCQKCLSEKISQSLRLTKEEYIQKLQNINPSVVVLGEYQNIKTPLLHKCLIHDYEWTTSPAVTLQGCGCPECRGEKIAEKLTKNHEEYVAELKLINPNIVAIDKYINANTPILHRCLLDGNEWYIAPSNALHGYGCPKCNMSKGEKSIEKWLIDHQIVHETQKRFDGCCDTKTLPFDFYLPGYNLCIEYDGQQHYEPVNFGGISDEEANNNYKKTVRHDAIKNEFCENNNISLLRIPFYKNPNEELNNFLFI